LRALHKQGFFFYYGFFLLMGLLLNNQLFYQGRWAAEKGSCLTLLLLCWTFLFIQKSLLSSLLLLELIGVIFLAFLGVCALQLAKHESLVGFFRFILLFLWVSALAVIVLLLGLVLAGDFSFGLLSSMHGLPP
jgi:hypothetical protein